MLEYTFKTTNESATSLEELVELCDQHWDEAKSHLYSKNRPIEDWLIMACRDKQSNLNDIDKERYRNLAKTIREITKENEDWDVGLERFLQSTALVDDPTPELDFQEIHIDTLKNINQTKLHLKNMGRGHLYGTIKSGPNLTVEPQNFSGNDVEIIVTISDSIVQSKGVSKSEIVISTNAQRRAAKISIPVHIGAAAGVTRGTKTDRSDDSDELIIQILVQKAERYINNRDWNAASNVINQVLKFSPGEKTALDLREKVNKQRSQIELLLNKAQDELKFLRLHEADELYKRVLQLEPGNPIARQGIQRVREQRQLQEQMKKGCALTGAGLVVGIGVGWLISRTAESTWFILYSGLFSMTMTITLLNGLFLLQNKAQGLLNTLLLPVGQLSILFGTYVLWQNWIISIVLALTAGQFLFLQLQATFCWDIYKTRSTGNIKNALRNLSLQ
ncbi:hypothetical protein JXA70_05365 [candidate division KSB1 bacterium]|nr:hypothetical protein [candidate division KSB1 bacterium]